MLAQLSFFITIKILIKGYLKTIEILFKDLNNLLLYINMGK